MNQQKGPGDNTDELAEVFRDASTHLSVAGIIRDQLTSDLDVREVALEGLDISKAEKVLDLGCGFGFFTQGLAGKISPMAEVTGVDVHEKYREYFLDSGKAAGIKSSFISEGISTITRFPPGSFDLVLCSYALYFFPEYIPHLSRVLKDDGALVIITHSCPHMKEFTWMVKEILSSENIPYDEMLPYEKLIGKFCDYNGSDLLSPYFKDVTRKEYRSEITFSPADYGKFTEYFRFKFPFFIPSGQEDQENLAAKILEKVGEFLQQKETFRITKDDTIFLCTNPLKRHVK